MNGSRNIVSDLLLGLGLPTVQQNGSSITAGQNSTGLNFAALLNMFSGNGLNQTSANTAQFNLTAMLGQKKSSDPTSGNSVPQQLQALLGFGMSPMPAMSATPTTKSNLITAPNASLVDSADAATSVKVQMLAANGTQLSLPVREIPEGNYKVKDATIANGNLNMTLVHKDDPTIELRVTLPSSPTQAEPQPTSPVSLLTNAQSKSVSTISPGNGSQHTPQMEQLLTQLKASEITVNQPHTLVAETPDQATTMQITTNQNVASQLVAEQMTLNQPKEFLNTLVAPKGNAGEEPAKGKSTVAEKLAIRLVDPKATTASTELADAVRPTTMASNSETSQQEQYFRPTAVKINNRVMTKEYPSIAALLESTNGETSSLQNSATELAAGSWSTSRQSQSVELRMDQTAVKVIVPKDLSELLTGSHKSVSLKLDPQYLGPARLSLVMHGDALTAKITVETQQAKAALDHSMNQLNDQLAQAGVKVDLINVNVRGGGADNQSFRQQQDWLAHSRPHMVTNESELTMEQPTVVTAVGRTMSQNYVNGRGVNLYA
jgi:flagellar hook-length control protein FliK